MDDLGGGSVERGPSAGRVKGAHQRAEHVFKALQEQVGAADRQDQEAHQEAAQARGKEEGGEALEAATVGLAAALGAVEEAGRGAVEGEERVAGNELAWVG